MGGLDIGLRLEDLRLDWSLAPDSSVKVFASRDSGAGREATTERRMSTRFRTTEDGNASARKLTLMLTCTARRSGWRAACIRDFCAKVQNIDDATPFAFPHARNDQTAESACGK